MGKFIFIKFIVLISLLVFIGNASAVNQPGDAAPLYWDVTDSDTGLRLISEYLPALFLGAITVDNSQGSYDALTNCFAIQNVLMMDRNGNPVSFSYDVDKKATCVDDPVYGGQIAAFNFMVSGLDSSDVRFANHYSDDGDQGYNTLSAGWYNIEDGIPNQTGTPVVPEPISSILFITGGAALLGRGYLNNRQE